MTFRELAVLEGLDRCAESAKELFAILKKKRIKRRLPEIIRNLERLKNEFRAIEPNLPENKIVTDRTEAFWRHIGFVERYLASPRHDLVVNNMVDVCKLDLPMIKDQFTDEIRKNPVVHPKFRQRCGNLVAAGEYSSAIREGFILIKELARVKFPDKISTSLDGQNLMEALFKAEGGLIKVHKEKDKQRAFQDWAKSLYGFFRNDEMHNSVKRPLFDVECVLMSINRLLFAVDPGLA